MPWEDCLWKRHPTDGVGYTQDNMQKSQPVKSLVLTSLVIPIPGPPLPSRLTPGFLALLVEKYDCQFILLLNLLSECYQQDPCICRIWESVNLTILVL
ncbi:uncharacterized protein LOC144582363 isoform X2 [Callithrix jacchus]